jgi:RND family efflux transporter MFP subunit
MKGKIMLFKQTRLLALALMAVIPLSACKDKAEAPAADETAAMMQNGIPARVEHPQVREIVEWSEFTGRFQAMQRVEIRARVSGYLDEVKFEDGQIVQEGDVLFVIDPRPYQIAVDGAQANYDATYGEYKRAKKLRSSRAISEEDYDARVQAMQTTRAELDKANLNLEFTQVKAPFTGRISNNRIDVGNLVSGDATLLTTVVTTAPIEFKFEVTETDMLTYVRARKEGNAAQDIAKGYPVFVQLQDEKEFLHEGKIIFLDNELDSGTGTVQVRAVFDNQSAIFEPGMFARLRIAHGNAEEKVLIPQDVIGTEQTRKFVYVLDGDNKAQRKYVTLGDVSEDGLQIISEGLTKDDRIVVGGLHMIRQPGTLIMPIDAAAMAKQQEQAGVEEGEAE